MGRFSKLEIRPLTKAAANAAIRAWHRHNEPVFQVRLAVGAFRHGELVGVATVENPRAPAFQTGLIWEITRVATPGMKADQSCDGAQSALSRACWLASSALGIRRLVTYTRVDEFGVGYRAAGFVPVALVDGREHTTGNRAGRWLPGLYMPTSEIVDRVRWEIGPEAATTRVRLDEGTWQTVERAA